CGRSAGRTAAALLIIARFMRRGPAVQNSRASSFPGAGGVRSVHIPDGLGLLVLIEGFQPVVPAAESRLLVSAERRGDVAFGKSIDGYGSRAQGAGDALCALQILRVDGCGQAVDTVVGQADGLLLV